MQAGHPAPLVLRADGGIERVGSGGMPLGLISEARYRQFQFVLGAGDRLLLYSDGLTDCPKRDGGVVEEEGLTALLLKHWALSGEEMRSAMAAELEELTGGADFPDDVSALLVEFDGPDD